MNDNRNYHDNGENNASDDVVDLSSGTVKKGYYRSRLKKSAGNKDSPYGGKLHNRTGTTGKKRTSKEVQKSLMKKELQVRAFTERANETANAGGITKRLVDKAEDMAGRIAEAVREFVESHPLGIILAGLILVVVLMISGSFSAFSMVAGGGNDMVISTSFTAEDADIIAVENDYKALEAAVQEKISNVPADHPGFDEYNYNIAGIGHDSFELASYLTIVYENYTESGVQGSLQGIADAQYVLTFDEVTEIRTKTETKWHYVTYYTTEEATGTRTVDGVEETYTYYVSVPYEVYESYEEEVEYEYKILNTTLVNNGIQATVNAAGFSADQMERYLLILGLKGNKPDIFN